jgi:transcriptional regulator with XRE-family HTH domain
VSVLVWLQADAQAALATGRLSLILRTWRRITRATQSQAADILGYEKSYISRLENSRRDVTGIEDRRRIAVGLGLAPHVLGVTDAENGDYRTMIEFGEATLRLAAVARNAGHPAAALNEIWPLILRLEDRVHHGHVEPQMISLLARARSALGVYLGDVLPTDALAISSRWTGNALDLTERLGDADLHARALRAHGNELRKAGKLGDAIRRLRHSAEIASAELRPMVLVALARAAADAGHEELFHDATSDAEEFSKTVASPLFNPAIVAEVRLRGLLHLGKAREAARELQELVDLSASAPQWRAISLITMSEVLAAVDEIDEAARILPTAINAARSCRLPQQLQRIMNLGQGTQDLERFTVESRAAILELSGPKQSNDDR